MEIINWKKNSNPNSVMKGSFTLKVTVEDLQKHGPLFLDCTFFEKDNGEHWVNWCGKEYTSKEGKKKNWNMARWERASVQDTKAEVKGLIGDVRAVVDDLPF